MNTRTMTIFDDEVCAICNKPSDYVLFDEGEPFMGWCKEHHEESRNREDCDCFKRPKMKFVPYRDKAGEYRWSLVADNGNIIADSSEGYRNKADRDEMILHIKENAKYFKIEE